MKRHWIVAKKYPAELEEKFPDTHPVILQLLYNRGILEQAAFKAFFQPRYESLSSPFLLSGMERASARILEALRAREKIFIYADYDADAVTACAVLYRTLVEFGALVDTYIPDRFTEGYGLNLRALKEIADRGGKLVITVDCGINAVEEAAEATSLGMDMVITDHHEITGELPAAAAVVNPKLDRQRFDLQSLTGVGVAFKLASALLAAVYPNEYSEIRGWAVPKAAAALGKSASASVRVGVSWEKWLLDLVAIGTVADCQSLLGESRILVKYGLQVLSKTRWTGLKQLMRNAGLEARKDFETFDVGFILAPRINAAGRIQHADIAFRLLTTDDPEEAAMYAGQLESLNAHRQRLTEQIISEARAQVLPYADAKILLASGENWPKGVVGLVAARLSEEFSRPALVLERGVSVATGSARSVSGFNIVKAFSKVSTYLEKYGGHPAAAGVTLKNEHIPAFHRGLLEYAELNLKDEDMVKRLQIDSSVDAGSISDELVEKIAGFAPFGPGNPQPSFLLTDLVVENLRTVGSTNKHLKVHTSSNEKLLEFIGFNHAWRYASLKPGDRVDIVAEPSHNHWNGRRKIQLKVLDIRKH